MIWLRYTAIAVLFQLATADLIIEKDEQVLAKQNTATITPTIHNSSAPIPQDQCSGYRSEHFVDVSGIGFTAVLSLNDECNVYGTDVHQLGLSVQYQSENRVSVSITPIGLKAENETYYELPEEIIGLGHVDRDSGEKKSNLVVDYGNEPSFWFSISRKDTEDVLFTTKGSHIVFENQFIEFRSVLPEGHNLYGLGETIWDFKISPGTVRTMHNADISDLVGANLYGTHPFYVEQRYADGKGYAHGVFLRNAHSQEIVVGETSLTWRTIGGSIELYFFAGPTVKEVVKQYQHVIGLPAMHQYWTLGFHHSRWGIESADELLDIATKYEEKGIPLETMWSDLDYMHKRRDFTVDPEKYGNFKEVLEQLHDSKRRYVPLVDAAIYAGDEDTYPTYQTGLKNEVFVKNHDKSVFVGEVWPGPCVFPDWLGFNTPNWWLGELKKFHEIVPYDGLWLDMNEVSSFCTAESCASYVEAPTGPYGTFHNGTVASEPHINARSLRFPPYVLNNTAEGVELGAKTMPMSSLHGDSVKEYDWHNLWGYEISRHSYNSLSNEILAHKRPFLVSRSTFAGSGAFAGHWGGDNFASWDYMRYSISQGLSFSLFGIPMFGVDVCGFHDESSEELCNRWSQLGAFFSFYRNHNDWEQPRQEFYIWESVTEAAKKAMDARYKLLPYFYTLLFKAHKEGETFLRALAWEFPDDPSLASIDTQFLVGPSILVVPVLQEGATTVEAVLPSSARWYDWWSKKEVATGKQVIEAPLGHIPLFIRGGSVLATQEPGLTTSESRNGEWEVIIALDHENKASGELLLDDGETIEGTHSVVRFQYGDGKLAVTSTGSYPTPELKKITLIGQNGRLLSKVFGGGLREYNVAVSDWTAGLEIELK